MKSETPLGYGLWSFLAAAVACAGAAAGCGGASPLGAEEIESVTGAASSKCPPAAPAPALVVPDGNRIAFSFGAAGVQIYACVAAGEGFAWVLQAPEATLFNPGGQTAGIHYVGPTWEANDGSTVVGARLAAATVDPTAIPWLLLGATANTGSGRMQKVSFIQRFDTTAGKAPPAATCDAGALGQIARADYTATYHFYEPKPGNGGPPASCR